MTLALAVAIPGGPLTNASAVAPQEPGKAELALTERIDRTDNPAKRVSLLQTFLSKYPKSHSASRAHALLIEALLDANASPAELVTAMEAALAKMPQFASGSGGIVKAVASALAARGQHLDEALRYAKMVVEVDQFPEGRDIDQEIYDSLSVLGEVQLARGDLDSAIASFTASVDAAPADQSVARASGYQNLGTAYERAGRREEAISAYVRALALAPDFGRDVEPPLRRLYMEIHGSLEGLAERIEEAKHPKP